MAYKKMKKNKESIKMLRLFQGKNRKFILEAKREARKERKDELKNKSMNE